MCEIYSSSLLSKLTMIIFTAECLFKSLYLSLFFIFNSINFFIFQAEQFYLIDNLIDQNNLNLAFILILKGD